jgi:hypothetical protein
MNKIKPKLIIFIGVHRRSSAVKKAVHPLGHGFFRLKKPGPLS